jgi:hypothetical protein
MNTSTIATTAAPEDDVITGTTEASISSSSPRDVRIAGRTNYGQWDKIATDLVKEVEEQDKEEAEIEKGKVCLPLLINNS